MKKAKQALVLILCFAMLLTLCACGGGEETPSKATDALIGNLTSTQKQESTQQTELEEPPTQPQETLAAEKQPKSLSDLVTMTDVTIEPVEMHAITLVTYPSDYGYLITATVSNESDICCDVYPAFSVTITDTDNYGDEQMQDYVLLNTSEIRTPYGPNLITSPFDSVFLTPVGLAPHETKTIRYYVQTGFSAVEKVVEDTFHAASYSGKRTERIYLSSISSVTNIELCALNVRQASMVYIAAENWGKDISLEEVDASVTGLTKYLLLMQGTIKNNTSDRWETMFVKFDFIVNDQALGFNFIQRSFRSCNYMDIGDEKDLTIDPEYDYVVAYEEPIYQWEIIPALLAYSPDA